MERYDSNVHGGDVERVCTAYGFDPEAVLDFSSNVNPLPLPVAVRKAIVKSIDTVRRYPDREYTELKEAISRYIRYAPAWIVPGNGATELIFLAVKTLHPARALLPVPSFGEYERALRHEGSSIDFYYLREESSFVLSVEDFVCALKRGYDMVFICNPNNPTGKMISLRDMCRILEEAQRSRTYVVVDETFIEFTESGQRESVLNVLHNFENAIVIRAFTKFFGIPGLRLGYCIANPEVAKRLSACKEPWTVNCIASAAGIALLDSTGFIERTREWISKERPFMYAQLQSIPWLKVFESSCNFFLVKLMHKGFDAVNLKCDLEKKGVMIRYAGTFRGLDSSFFRVAVKERKDNMKLVEVMRSLFSSYGLQ